MAIDEQMVQDVENVRLSFRRSQSRSDFADAFYDHLASQSAEIGPMFAETDMVKQNELLRLGIMNLIEFAGGSPSAHEELLRLGEIHDRTHFDVRPDLYPLWVNALLETVRETDAECTAELEAAWRRVVAPGIELIVSMY